MLFYSFGDVMSLRDMLTKENPNLTQLNLTKLERMQQFAEAASCRRKILLNYFGETLATDCGNCDICRNPPTTFDGTELAQKALSAVVRGRERMSINLLIDVLRGMRNQAVLSQGLDQIKTYGAGRDLAYLDWYSYIHQMLNDGLLYIAYEEGYALKITELGREVLQGQRTLPMKKFQPAEKAEKAPRGRKAAAPAKAAPVSREAQLFEALRTLRKRISDEQGVPPYVIFTDSTLQEMATERPINRVAMLSISGVGMKKFETYGDAFIREVLAHGGNPAAAAAELDFDDDAVSLDPDDYSTAAKTATRKKEAKAPKEPKEAATEVNGTMETTHQLHRMGLSVEAIAQRRDLAVSTVQTHLTTCYAKGLELRIEDFLKPQELAEIQTAQAQLGGSPMLRDLFDHLREQYDYFRLRLALMYFKKLRGE
ncbi:RQC domain-containing protein [Hymenobacter sp. 5516J-16]|uniref:RQC domain-containing protein n=1 Tax=Hymenobacter sp. 5516J-16 TaxID=2932253 RepID=UPI00293E48ED|nr:RQC domain-containing protein [Hymenobacter sp. 5516J-16]